MYMYAMVYTNLYACGYDQVHAGMYWYVLVCTDIYLPVTVYTCVYQYTQSPVSMRQYVLVCTSMYQYILVHTSIYSNFLLTNALFLRYSIHHDTSRYKAVQWSTRKSCIPGLRQYKEVHQGTRLCTAFVLIDQGRTPDQLKPLEHFVFEIVQENVL